MLLKEEYSQLVHRLNEASDAYYNSENPIMSDQEYDYWFQQISNFEKENDFILSISPTQKIGAPVLSSLKRVPITPKPMLSLDKCHSDEEVADFANNHKMIAMLKLDGLSVRIKYNNGKLISANTRGNGVEGTDITEHIKQFQNIPMEISFKGEFIIDGEAIIKIKDFEEINENNEFKNPRNAAAGALNVLDTKLVRDRKLSFVAWDIIKQKESEFGDVYLDLIYLGDKLKFAQKLGFETTPFVYWENKPENSTIKEINESIMSFNVIYPCDGVVWKFNNTVYGDSLGQTSHHFKNGIAWKPEVETVETRLQNIQWTMGRTGVLTPVAVFDPVELDGSVIERASLHNYSVMRKTLGDCAYVGEPLTIFKANLIIPKILKAGPFYNYGEVVAAGGVSANDELECCPVCHGEVQLKTSLDGVKNYVCVNPSCEGKLVNHLDHFCGKKGLDIKGLSKATLGKLIDWDLVKEFHDIFTLRTHRSELILKQGFGEKSVDNILNAIEDIRTSNIPLEKYISAIGIPLIGSSQAKELAKHFKDFPSFVHATEEGSDFDFYTIDGFGPERVGSILNFDYGEAIWAGAALEKWPTSTKEEDNLDNLKDIIVVITGSLKQYKNRAALQSEIESRGGRVSSAVSAKTNYLINNDNTSTSSKNLTAKKLGVPIITEQEFIEKFLQE